MLILVQIILMVAVAAEGAFHMQQGFAAPGGYRAARYVIFAALTAVSLLCAWGRVRLSLLLAPLAALFTIPAAENLPFFLPLAVAALLFWVLRSTLCLLYQMELCSSRLSALSIKEALDRLDSGILYCRKDGRVILQNELMQELMTTLAGGRQADGKVFYENLVAGRVMPNCRKITTEKQAIYQLPDKRVWSFSVTRMDTRWQKKVLLLASDVTEWWTASRDLKEKTELLQQKNAELRSVLQNLDQICRTEAVIQTKGRVHDVLGQSISMLLRAMREHREPDELLLRSFADGLPKELKEVTADGGYSLDTLAKVFETLGVRVHVDGWLPEQELLARTFYEIAVEAVTNAVRHGYAADVFITLVREHGSYVMEITNRGMMPEQPLKEGGGLREMREKIAQLGGSFYYEINDQFCIHAELPEGEEV